MAKKTLVNGMEVWKELGAVTEDQEVQGLKEAKLIAISLIQPNPNQPRKSLNREALQELAESTTDPALKLYYQGMAKLQSGDMTGIAALKKLEIISFNRESIKNTIHSFQLPIYYYFTKQKYRETVNAALYNLQEMAFTDLVKKDKDNTGRVMEICLKGLDFIISEILNSKVDFTSDKSNEQNCKYCEFIGIC